MPIVDLVDSAGYLIGRDTTEEAIRDGYVMQIRDGEDAIRIIPVPQDNLPIPMDTEVAKIYDIGAII